MFNYLPMKALLRKLFNFLGYEVSRINYLKKVPRSSMDGSIEWLRNTNFNVATVLDVGASDGRWSRDCMKHFIDANYVLYEPQACHFYMLDLIEKEFYGKIKVVKKAVGKESGKIYFDITNPFGGALAVSKNANTVEVNLTSIDISIKELGLKGPFLLKLDTHGFEIPILEGAAQALNECEVLIIEAYNYNIEPESVLFWQLCEYLDGKGFRPIDMVDSMYREYDNSFWQMDLVFIKSSWLGFQHISYK